MRAALKAMGRNVRFKVGPWNEIKQELAEGRLEALPLVGRTPERELYYDFSIPYITLYGAIFTRASEDNIAGLKDLADRRLGVMRGDNSEEFLRREHVSEQLILTSSFKDAFLKLSRGEVDAVVSQRLVGLNLIEKLKLDNLKTAAGPLQEFQQSFSFAVPKGNSVLLAQLNEGLAVIIADGTYEHIRQKWLGILNREENQQRFIWQLVAGTVTTLFLGLLLLYVYQAWRAHQQLKISEERWQFALEGNRDGVWDWNVITNEIFFSKRLKEMLGYDETDIGNSLDEWEKRIHPDDKEQTYADMKRLLDTETPYYENEHRMLCKDGSYKWILDRGKIFSRTKDNKPLRIIGTHMDITARKEAEDNQRLAASVFTHSQESVIITDTNNRIVDVNPACLQLTGYTREETLGQDPRIFSSGKHPPGFYSAMWKTLAKRGHWQGEIQNRKKSGGLYTERLSIDAVHDKNGKLQHYVGAFSDISYLKEHAVALEQIAYNDTLTGLPNRLLLRDRMEQALAQAERHKKLLAVCYLDLDGFKSVNDTYGHQVGDHVLLEVAVRLQQSLRSSDTVARLGGDEFILLMPDFQQATELEHLLGRVLKNIAKPYSLGGEETSLSASIGIAVYPHDDGEADTLLRHADQAMYAAKQGGKNRYCFFDSSEEQRAMATTSVQREIEMALAHGQLQLYYQPKINMASGAMAGVEALVRWQHPKKGLLLPDAFLPAIEHSELIIDLGNWVLRQALSRMRAWQAEGRELEVSVNIAAPHLQQADFVPSLKALLAEFPDIPASRLQLEILETAALQDISHVNKIISECAEFGVQFALDDFGTGYSSLTYLKHLPAQALKIDRSFICDLLDNAEDLAITKGILGLAHAFHRTVIAEGVESVAHGTLLLELGCKLAQGYGIAHPMPAQELLAWLDSYQVPHEWKRVTPDYMI